MSVVVIIPARFDSTRLPGKPLALIDGRPMIRHVYDRAAQAPDVAEVVVATDDERIAASVRGFGGRAVMTSPAHASGTDRVAEAARQLAFEGLAFDRVVNVQGDEPFLDPGAVAECAARLAPSAGGGLAPMSTLARPLAEGELEDPAVVKVVCRLDGTALLFSRAPRRPPARRPGESAARAHVGIYGYTAAFLQAFAKLSPNAAGAAERLEQLRALEHGHPIAVADTRYRARGIDTPEDLARANART